MEPEKKRSVLMLYKYMDVAPEVHPTAYVAPTATVIGNVKIQAGASVWFGTVLRGDIDHIWIGTDSSIQDNATIHVTGSTCPTRVGNRVIVGHGAILHGCTLEDDVLIGMGATILDNAVVGKGSIVAAGALVREGQHVPPGTMVAGVPATVRRKLLPEDRNNMQRILNNYTQQTKRYQSGAAQVIRPES